MPASKQASASQYQSKQHSHRPSDRGGTERPVSGRGEIIAFDVFVNQDVALRIHHADVHLAGMQVDSAVVFRGGVVVPHSCSNSGAARHLINVSSRGECC